MARPRNADGQRTRQAILDAALDLFAQNGFFGTSLRDVATAVGVRESALYNYFPSKDALFEALLLADQHSKVERLASLAEERITDVRSFLEQLVLEALQSFAEPRQQQLFRILMSDGIRLARDGRINLFERLGDRRERMEAIMRRLVREGWLRAGDPQVLALSFAAPLFMCRHLHAIDADLSAMRKPVEFARLHVEQFLAGASSAPIHLPGRRRSAVTRRTAAERRARSTRQQL
jgi:AcrR family transcriptional regulator